VPTDESESALGGDVSETSSSLPLDLDAEDASDEVIDPPSGPFEPDREDGMPKMPPSDIHLQAPGKWSPIAYAFLGDAVWELYVRRLFFSPPQKPLEYDLKCKRAVKAEAQDWILRKLVGKNFFTDDETKIIKWGRNAAYGNVPTRLRGKGKGGFAVYRNASALECFVGYLYMTDLRRLEEMMAALGGAIEEIAKLNEK
jgi:ribonuclease-3 family protein